MATTQRTDSVPTQRTTQARQSRQRPNPAPSSDQAKSTAQLVVQASEQMRELVQNEIRLAQAEMEAKAKKAAAGAGLFAGTSVLALYATACLVTAALLGLSTVMAAWAAALVVAGGLLLIAGVAALVGKRDLEDAMPPVPTEATHGLAKDFAAFKQGATK